MRTISSSLRTSNPKVYSPIYSSSPSCSIQTIRNLVICSTVNYPLPILTSSLSSRSSNSLWNKSIPSITPFNKYFSTASNSTIPVSLPSSLTRSEWVTKLQIIENSLTHISSSKANVQDLVNIWADIRTLCDQFSQYCAEDIEQLSLLTNTTTLGNSVPSSSTLSSSSNVRTSSSPTSSPPSLNSLQARLHLLFLTLFDTVWNTAVRLYGNILDDKEENLLTYVANSRTGLPSSTTIDHMYSIELHSCCKDILRTALRYGCTPDIRVFDKYIRLLGLRSVSVPRDLFNIIKLQGIVPNFNTYRSLLLVAARHNTPVDALPVLIAMREHKYRPDAFVLSAILGDVDKLLSQNSTTIPNNNILHNDDGRLRLVIDVALAGAEEEVAEAVDELQAAQARVNEGIAALEAVEADNNNDNDDDTTTDDKKRSRNYGKYSTGLRRKEDDSDAHETETNNENNVLNRSKKYRKISKFPKPNITEEEMKALTEVLEAIQRSQESKDIPDTNKNNQGKEESVSGDESNTNNEEENNQIKEDLEEEEEEDISSESESHVLDPVPPTLAMDAERWKKLAEQVLRENTNPEGLSPMEFQQKILALRANNRGETDGRLESADLLPSEEIQKQIEQEAIKVLEENKKLQNMMNEQTNSLISSSKDLAASNNLHNTVIDKSKKLEIVGSLSGTEWKLFVTAYREACTTIAQRRYDYFIDYATSLLNTSPASLTKGSAKYNMLDPRLRIAIYQLTNEQKFEILQLFRKRLENGLFLPANITLLGLDNPDYLQSLAKHTIQDLSLSSSTSTSESTSVPSKNTNKESISIEKSNVPNTVPPIIRNQILSSLLYTCLSSETNKISNGEEMFTNS